MGRGSRRQNERSKAPRFGPETKQEIEPVISISDLSPHLDAGSVSVSLRYFRRECECFSDWQKAELKKFVGTLEKLRSHSVDQLKGKKSLCDIHKGKPNEARFNIPDAISPDLSIYEIKIDPSNKLRMHGFFTGPVFFLLWLDRMHACFKSG